MRIELIITGDEVLRGAVLEDNSAWISRRLFLAGLAPSRITVLPDDRETLAVEIAAALGRGGEVIVTGGLGPTVDDVTREASIEALGGATEERPEIAASIRRRFEEAGLEMPEGYHRLSVIPAGAEVLENRRGAAPGLKVERGTATLYLLPGVPEEMKSVFVESVLPRLEQGEPGHVLRVFGLPETAVERRLASALGEKAVRSFSIICGLRGISVYMPPDIPGEAFDLAVESLRPELFGVRGESLAEAAVAAAAAAGAKVASAESVTGGMIASMIVSVPGASEVFTAGWVTYGDEAKVDELGVDGDSIAARGAVSAEVCSQMAEGARERAGSGYALSTTGIAGPSGGSAGKPVGLCYIGLATEKGTEVRRSVFHGDREAVRVRAACTALDMLRRSLEEARR